MTDFGPLQFLRPAWLVALLALPLLFAWLRRATQARADWQRAIDPHLLPHLLEAGPSDRRRGFAWLACLAYLIAVLALAGPAWRQVEQPAWQTRLPLVVAVDMSSATLATDMPPTRLAQVRARLGRLLQAHRGAPIALVAFAGDAFTVAPLTDDAQNVALFVDALQPDVMPVDGQSPARAIAWSRRLLERAGYPQGRIVLITDRADAAAQRAAAEAQASGISVSALGIGTAAGADVRTLRGGDARAALDEPSLRALAQSGGGRYARLALGGSDDAIFSAGTGAGKSQGASAGRTWADEGFVLVPVLMLLALVLLARRPRMASALLVLVLLPRVSPAADLWLRPDQRAHRSVTKGIDLYRRGEFERAAQTFAGADTATAHYDRGNALAKAGQLQDAVGAYDAALARNPGMPDAVANRRAVLEALKRRQQQGRDGQSGREGNSSKQSQQTRNCAPGDAACESKQAPPQPSPDRRSGQQSKAPAPPQPQDAKRQAQADAAQRERMRRALQQARAPKPNAQPRMTPAQRERKLSDDAALARVPDEPGNLLREKFRLEHERRQSGEGP